MPKIIPKYLVILNSDYIYRSKTANSVKELILELADYTHDKTDLFVKALNGMETDDDMVKLYNHFSSAYIVSIDEISKSIYNKEM